jgi:nucleotide-binding universal stress UspA family protein
MKTIVVAIDFSPATAAVMAAAATLARVHRGRLVLVHVVQPPIYLPEYGGMLETIVSIVHQTEKAGARFLIQWKRALHRRGVAVTTVQADGHPATEILQQARSRRAALIVLGSHGHSAGSDLMAGSTACGVLKRAPCPVVVVPAHSLSRTPART